MIMSCAYKSAVNVFRGKMAKNVKIQNAKINQSCDKLECNYNFPLCILIFHILFSTMVILFFSIPTSNIVYSKIQLNFKLINVAVVVIVDFNFQH